MKNRRSGLAAVLIGLGLLLGAGSVSVAAQSGNLLTNPGFEAPFASIPGQPVRQVAQGWQPWNLPQEPGMSFSQNVQPEYYPASDRANGLGIPRIHGGSDAQQFLTYFATSVGGVFQQVSGLSAGQTLRFAIFAHAWSSALDNPDVSEQDGGLAIEVGIDPTGGTDPTASSVVWSPTGPFLYDGYNEYAVTTSALGGSATVFVRASSQQPVKNNVVYLDDASLTALGEPISTAVVGVPTATSLGTEPPTITPGGPSETPTTVASLTPSPIPSETPLPSATTGPTALPTIDNTQYPGRFVYVVQTGDTVANIASAFGSSVDIIISANGLDENGLIFVGQQLVIPVRLPFEPPTATPPGEGAVLPTANVLPGATVDLIATALPTSTPLPIATSGPAPTTAPETIRYRVQPGDTLYWIAVRYGTTVNALAQLNNISNPNLIFAGQTLLIPVNTPQAVPTAVQIPTLSGQAAPEVQTYRVQPGDNLYNIALQNGVPLSELAAVNGIVNPNLVYVGQVLIIP